MILTEHKAYTVQSQPVFSVPVIMASSTETKPAKTESEGAKDADARKVDLPQPPPAHKSFSISSILGRPEKNTGEKFSPSKDTENSKSIDVGLNLTTKDSAKREKLSPKLTSPRTRSPDAGAHRHGLATSPIFHPGYSHPLLDRHPLYHPGKMNPWYPWFHSPYLQLPLDRK